MSPSLEISFSTCQHFKRNVWKLKQLNRGLFSSVEEIAISGKLSQDGQQKKVWKVNTKGLF